MPIRNALPLAAAFVAGLVTAVVLRGGGATAHAADAPPASAKPDDGLAALKAEVARLKGMVPDQSVLS